MKKYKAYKALVSDDFTPTQALSLLWIIWKTDHLPHRTYELNFEASEAMDELVFSSRTWWWHGHQLHKKTI